MTRDVRKKVLRSLLAVAVAFGFAGLGGARAASRAAARPRRWTPLS